MKWGWREENVLDLLCQQYLKKHNQKGREQGVGLVDSPHHPAPSILRGRLYWKEVVALLASVLSQGEVLRPPAQTDSPPKFRRESDRTELQQGIKSFNHELFFFFF